MSIEINNLTVKLNHKIILDNINLLFNHQKITAIIGPNGSGKSTLLKTMARLINPIAGSIIVDKKNYNQYKTREYASKLAFLPQSSIIPPHMTVQELVWFGRFPHRRFLQQKTKHDKLTVERALAFTQLETLAHRSVQALSGGQQQSAWIAMILAQDTPYILLDEPTTFLDIACQLDILTLLQKLKTEFNKTIIMVLHDLNQAMRFADDMVIIKNGAVCATGLATQTLTEQLTQAVFNINCCLQIDAHTDKPYLVPLSNIN